MFKKYISMTINRVLYNGKKISLLIEAGVRRVAACELL